jgi:MoaA/NifB/PqqE/SkfB family radical SAM enzyme
MFDNIDLKSYLQMSSFKVLDLLKVSPRIYLLPSIVIFPSNVCNYNCVMCPYARDTLKAREYMEFSLMKKLLDDLSRFLIKPMVHFSGGGEPLLYPNIKETMQLCKNRFRWGLTTNGFFLDKYAQELIKNRCHAINVSIHGNALENDRITQVKNSYKKVSENIRNLNKVKKELKSKRPLVAINCVFSSDNVSNLDSILKTFLTLPVNSITFQHLAFVEKDLQNKSSFLITEKEKLKKLIDFVKHIKKTRPKTRINFYPKIMVKDLVGYYSKKDYPFNNTCLLPWLSTRVYPNGDVGMCDWMFGNIKKDSLKGILNSKKARQFRTLVRKNKYNNAACFRCCHRHYY